MRSVLYRFPDLQQFEGIVCGAEGGDLELCLPAGEVVADGEWVLAIFELGANRRATSAAARATVSPEGTRLTFEPRDWHRLAQFAQTEATRPGSIPDVEDATLLRSPEATRPGSIPDAEDAALLRSPGVPEEERAPAVDRALEVDRALVTGRALEVDRAPVAGRALEVDRAPAVDRAPVAGHAPEADRTAAPARLRRPAPAGCHPPQAQAAPRQPKGKGSRILVVDDDPDIRHMVSVMLQAVELVVVTAASAEEALDCVRSAPIDLVVLDWNLPRMSGIDLCRTLRREPELGELPILFLTANASSQDMVDAFASGADDYVVKPFRAPELGARIFSLLRRTRRCAS